jgi:D-glycero-alpha-D-manno-heptose-7-phosphate kinase
MRIIKAKAPMRIGFFGGGTDVSPYAEEHGGRVLNCTIDKYVRCMLRPHDSDGVVIRSLDLEAVSRNVTGRWDGRLSLPQAVLDAMPAAQGVEITMFSDVPPGSGLGSSSALVVSMLKLLATAHHLPLDRHELAELAYRIERVDLGIPGGRQDQYAAAFGGMSVYHFRREGVIVEPVLTDAAALLELESCLLIGYIGSRKLLTEHLVEDQVRRLRDGPAHSSTRRSNCCGVTALPTLAGCFTMPGRSRRRFRRTLRHPKSRPFMPKRGGMVRGAARSPVPVAVGSWSSLVHWSGVWSSSGC